MALVVQKYGGTSVASAERIQAVAARIQRAYLTGDSLVVVVSARAGVTDQLLRRAHEISLKPNLEQLDRLLGTGEQETVALLAIALDALGIPVAARTGPEAGILTDGAHTKAKIIEILGGDIKAQLKASKVVVVAGFQGVSHQGALTTLGRGGSDLTAIALGAALDADRCEIYTDVEGIYSADPRLIPNVSKVDVISYEEMLELAYLGARVMQPRAVALAQKYKLPFEVRSSYSGEPGTFVQDYGNSFESSSLIALALDQKHSLFTVTTTSKDYIQLSAFILKIKQAQLHPDQVSLNATEASSVLQFLLPTEHVESAKRIICDACDELVFESIRIETTPVAIISVLGVGLRTHLESLAPLLQACLENKMEILAVSLSEGKISFAVPLALGELAITLAHQVLNIKKTEVALNQNLN